MQRDNKLIIDIFDYANKIVCNLYDNQHEISGQATDVVITSERNGWKELSFEIPSTCEGENGQEENFRLNYLIAEYKIRVIDDYGTDWYIISEPKIQRSNFSKNVSVRAGHISQLLKHKNLDLEFSDEEGNNVGKAEELLTTILAGTDWNVGHVGEQNTQGVWHTFLEDDNTTAKQRSLTVEAGTGALSLIEKLCDTFEAKPVYYVGEDEKKYVDILPMNPFAKVQQEEIPALLRDKDLDILALYYDRNIHNLSKTVNTENMATRLYAYGSSGDMNGACTLQNAIHHEWQFTVEELGEEYQFAIGESYFYFKGNVSLNNVLVFSDMDITSMSYIYNNNKNTAYKVYKEPTTEYVTLTGSDPVEVKNQFAYLLGLKYYQDVGLMTDTQFQEVAKFQRQMPTYYTQIENNAQPFIEGEANLSELAEHATGFLKLSIDSVEPGDETKFIIKTSAGTNGVLYRSDYDKAERRYFQWHVTDRLDNNGDPVTGTPSILFIVHNTNPATYETAYLRCVWDTHGQVLNSQNEPKDFEYSTGNYPTAFTVWGEHRQNSGDRYYLFCTNSMQGLLGARMASLETIAQDLYNATMKHPVNFYNANSNEVRPAPTGAEYEWQYNYYNSQDGILYFCWKDKYEENTWARVYIAESKPSYANGYFYHTREKSLYRYNSGWKKIENEQTITRMFETVIYYCKKWDELLRGIHEYYYYSSPVDVGSYAISDGFNGYWLFKLKTSANNLVLSYKDGYVYTDVTIASSKPVITGSFTAIPQSVEARSLIFPLANELEGKTFQPGTINTSGIEERTSLTRFRTGFIPVNSSTEYQYMLPVNSDIYLYRSSKGFITQINTGELTTGSFTTNSNAYYIRIAVDEVQSTSYIKASDDLTTNLLTDRPFVDGTINTNGAEISVDRYRTYTISAYENTTYLYNLPANSAVYFYDVNLSFLGYAPLTNSASSGTFTTYPNTTLMRFVIGTSSITSSQYVRVQDYNRKVYMNREAYYVLPNISKLGKQIGIRPLVKEFADTADTTYNTYLANLLAAQQTVKTKEDNLASLLGDMLKDGRWQDSNYIAGDEKRLYDDAAYMLRQVSYPETTYSFNYLDMYGVKNPHFYEEYETKWPDIRITQTAHLVDTESQTNCWAYIDKVEKCYDCPWKTNVEIDTKLTLASRHGFSDVIARIAEVSKQIRAKQALYDQAATGKIDGSRIEGVVEINKVYLDGGDSNWYTDEKGNMVFEATDGLSAMLLGGRGLAIATERADDGTWMWRTAATGYGLGADSITTGYLSAERIEAGTVTLDKLSSNVGKELQIGSNSALMMFATQDGTRPAGALKTTDGYIEVKAGNGNIPAKINIVSGGEINLNGGAVNIRSQGKMDVSSGGVFVLKAQGANSINSTVNGLYVNSEEGINFGGGRFVVEAHGDTSRVVAKADYLELGQQGQSFIKMDTANGGSITVEALNKIDIKSGNTVTISADKVLSLITNGTIEIGKTGHLFTIGADNYRSYIYNGLSSISGNTNGVYIGTDGFALRQTANNKTTSFTAYNGQIKLETGNTAENTSDFVSISSSDANYRIWAGNPSPASAPFWVKKDGSMYASKGIIGGFTIGEKQLNSGSGSTYFAINTDNTWSNGNYVNKYAIWIGDSSAENASFRVSRNGSVDINGGSITIKKYGTTNFEVTNEGFLTAISGKIGGWKIAELTLSAYSGQVGLQSTTSDDSVAIWAGSALQGSGTISTSAINQAKFRVYPTGKVVMSNAEIKGGSISITNSANETMFKVSDAGVITANSGTIGGWTIGKTTLTGNKVGLAKTTNDTDIAIWAGNATASSANFKVQQNGIMYAKGATIEGSTFVVRDSNNVKQFEINGSTGAVYIAARVIFGNGFSMDPNDFAGPTNSSGSVTNSSSGFVQINCNPSFDKRVAWGSNGQFFLHKNGYIYCNGIWQ